MEENRPLLRNGSIMNPLESEYLPEYVTLYLPNDS